MADLASIVRCAIHPAIGIARVGNSEDTFVGPEVPGVTPVPENGYKDSEGRIKRQAARFRVYGFDKKGNVVDELTAANAKISWTVHVANAKAAWYKADDPLDLPGARLPELRNASIEENRRALIIDPGPRTVKRPGESEAFDTGTFGVPDPDAPGGLSKVEVSLGSIHADRDGRLVFVGGSGVAGSPIAGTPLVKAVNNNGWYDEICDGPVMATVQIGDREPMEATSAWIISAPPDYAPGIRSIVTLYDVVYDVAVNKLGAPEPAKVSFKDHIYPILARFCQLQWVSQGFNAQFGWGQADDFLDPDLLKLLSDNGEKYAYLRRGWFEQFRHPGYGRAEPLKLPRIYGDNPDPTNDTGLPRKWLAVTHLQYSWLSQWAEGCFAADWDVDWGSRPPAPATRLDDLALADRPSALDRAALEPCLGGPFHPGCEAPWILRKCLPYAGPFRLKLRSAEAPQTAEILSLDEVLAPGGPLDGSRAGDLTKWMAVPWQTDTYACAVYFGNTTSPLLPTYWPARVPTHVLPEARLATIANKSLPLDYRRTMLAARVPWARFIDRQDEDRYRKFSELWGRFGIVTRRNGPGGADFPPDIFVEEGVNDDLLDILANF